MAIRKTQTTRKSTRTKTTVFKIKAESIPEDLAPDHEAESTCLPPQRVHSIRYHEPLLLSSPTSISQLLSWFSVRSSTRSMPWRKPFLHPSTSSTQEIQTRAYEIWISEIMLQQTRVSTVIPYWENWISKWPNVQALANAEADEVLAAWKGLGYYSRATRLWEAARQIVRDFGGNLPNEVGDLLKVKGVGRYTAGALGSIAFGKAVPLLDGNVSRVLSRQIGLYGRFKDKKIEDRLWEVADRLVRVAANYQEEGDVGEIPGQWNQGLMELGATICTPRPKCEDCPIQGTCRAFAEGESFAKKDNENEQVVDIEDSCRLCSPFEIEEVEAEAEKENKETIKKSKKRSASTADLPLRPGKRNKKDTKQQTILSFATTTTAPAIVQSGTNDDSIPSKTAAISPEILTQIKNYCSLFPQKTVKKEVPTEKHLICVLRSNNPDQTQKFLLKQRPSKGLLANLWEFPTLIVDDGEEKQNYDYTMDLHIRSMFLDYDKMEIEHDEKLGELTHVFSHLKVEMYVYSYTISFVSGPTPLRSGQRQGWFTAEEVENANLGTGMQKCWSLYKNALVKR